MFSVGYYYNTHTSRLPVERIGGVATAVASVTATKQYMHAYACDWSPIARAYYYNSGTCMRICIYWRTLNNSKWITSITYWINSYSLSGMHARACSSTCNHAVPQCPIAFAGEWSSTYRRWIWNLRYYNIAICTKSQWLLADTAVLLDQITCTQSGAPLQNIHACMLPLSSFSDTGSKLIHAESKQFNATYRIADGWRYGATTWNSAHMACCNHCYCNSRSWAHDGWYVLHVRRWSYSIAVI